MISWVGLHYQSMKRLHLAAYELGTSLSIDNRLLNDFHWVIRLTLEFGISHVLAVKVAANWTASSIAVFALVLLLERETDVELCYLQSRSTLVVSLVVSCISGRSDLNCYLWVLTTVLGPTIVELALQFVFCLCLAQFRSVRPELHAGGICPNQKGGGGLSLCDIELLKFLSPLSVQFRSVRTELHFRWWQVHSLWDFVILISGWYPAITGLYPPPYSNESGQWTTNSC
jgi:hypothetical protein